MKNIHWIILAIAVGAGFAAEVWPDSFAWAVTLSIWAVRAYVIVQSHAISQRIGKRWAYATTVAVAVASIWYVAALQSAGIVTPDQARALHILNGFLVILEVYVGILQSSHPDSVELAEARESLAELQETFDTLAGHYDTECRRYAAAKKDAQDTGAKLADSLQTIYELREQLAAEKAAAAKVNDQLARLQGKGCIGGKVDGRYFAFEAGKYAEGKRITDCMTIADNESKLRKKTGYSNGQLKMIKQ
jgi:hypothetical protein